MLCALWLGLTALLSVEPSLSLRRLALFAIAAMLSAGVLIVARSPAAAGSDAGRARRW